MQSAVRVFGRPSSSNTQKVLWGLAEAGVKFEVTLASARLGEGSQLLVSHTGAKPYGVVDTDEYKAKCPTRQVPLLQHNDRTVWESHSILRYIAQEMKPELHLDDTWGMAQCSPWMDLALATGFNMMCNHHLVDQMARTPPEARDYKLAEEAHAVYSQKFELFEEHLASSSSARWLAGDGARFSVADIPIGTELSRWSCAMERWGKDHEAGVAPALPRLPVLPGLRAYFQALQAR
eukprot:CAMPEP_0206508834 /NCGR_PEP_ID=MMETSP0324_2-20121206/58573_1 /ASSEMBLY_ACC=CAM_ASM_000836 /TAXON_ID=2866 /ORGANISM="Crypthecodinium cohnii, Strain Seligo" /LENGTH=234 /DNA_ID=CAMNT_0053999783 /DNA_START=25 /DNA_END=725 /DNA_ORIENTATION=+